MFPHYDGIVVLPIIIHVDILYYKDHKDACWEHSL